MAATIETTLIPQKREISTFLNEIADAEQSNWNFLCQQLPLKFKQLLVEASLQKTLNDLNPKILASDDKSLIQLFKRAHKNYNSLVKDTEQADPVTFYYKHHTQPDFTIPFITLTINVREKDVAVTTELTVKRNSQNACLILDGEDHQVDKVTLNGIELTKDQYKATKNELIISELPQGSTHLVKIESRINPFNNDSLEGMYQSGDILTTQCESEGARRIFFTLDRPDILSKITTIIIADQHKYPCILSNGNKTKDHAVENCKIVVWEDPIPKPSYLFACVLGNFECMEDTFTTKSGRTVKLEAYTVPGKVMQATYSLHALKAAMKHDEEFFDREYDLNSLKMVAIPNFNAGAMENKGLMIFNDIRMLGSHTTATDADLRTIAHVVAHEYDHNWSGNRVTVRDWFQIALKEAFTDFRAKKFSEYFYGEDYVRPKDIVDLEELQFPLDASENTHPIVVDSYVNPIYDHTIYTKGREIFRTFQQYIDFLAPNGFREVQNLYFKKYDGQAVTFQELLLCANEILKMHGDSLGNFEDWFHQMGTPTVKLELEYDSTSLSANVKVTQSCLNPKTHEKQPPLPIPFSIELYGSDGSILEERDNHILQTETQVFEFYTPKKPIPVVMHGYSAPVKVECNYSMGDLCVIIKHCSDTYNRWNAGRRYTHEALRVVMEKLENDPSLMEKNEVVIKDLLQVYADVLHNKNASPLAKVQLLEVPSLRALSQTFNCYDFKKLKDARSFFVSQLALYCKNELEQLLISHPEPQSMNPSIPTSEEMQIRELRNKVWALLAKIDPKTLDTVYENYGTSQNFTNVMAAFNILINSKSDKKNAVSEHFYEKWKDDKAVFNNWLIANAGSATCTVADLQKLEGTKGYDSKNPNHLRSIFTTFCQNLECYHDSLGEGYRYIVDKLLEIGAYNPKVASDYIAPKAFIDFERLPAAQKAMMAAEIKRLDISGVPALRDYAQKLLKGYTQT